MWLRRSSNKINAWNQTYLTAYRKFRYWISFLYIILLVQCWIVFTIPESGILTQKDDLIWNNKFLTYYITSFKPDTSLAKKINIADSFQNLFRYKLGEYIVNPNDKVFFSKAKSNLDSLVVFGLVDSSSASTFLDTLKSLIPNFIESFKSLHGVRSDSLIASVGDVMEERIKLLNKDRNEFQKLLDTRITAIYQQKIQAPLNNNLNQMLSTLHKDENITLATLTSINDKKFLGVNELLDKNLLKNPYLDLPLKTQYVLVLIIILSSLLYLYSNLLYEYYFIIETNISGYNLSGGLQNPSIKNIFYTLGIKVPQWLSNMSALFFYSFLPLFIISYYTIFLFEVGILGLSIIAFVGFIRLVLFINTKKSKITFSRLKTLTRNK